MFSWELECYLIISLVSKAPCHVPQHEESLWCFHPWNENFLLRVICSRQVHKKISMWNRDLVINARFLCFKTTSSIGFYALKNTGTVCLQAQCQVEVKEMKKKFSPHASFLSLFLAPLLHLFYPYNSNFPVNFIFPPFPFHFFLSSFPFFIFFPSNNNG
jgi:hypothetical protein